MVQAHTKVDLPSEEKAVIVSLWYGRCASNEHKRTGNPWYCRARSRKVGDYPRGQVIFVPRRWSTVAEIRAVDDPTEQLCVLFRGL